MKTLQTFVFVASAAFVVSGAAGALASSTAAAPHSGPVRNFSSMAAAGRPLANSRDASQFVDWPTYQFDRARDGFNPNTTAITPASIAGGRGLHLAWQVASSGSAGQPIVATNVAGHAAIVITEPFSGVEAFDALTGAEVWATTLPTQNGRACGTGGPSGTAQYDAARGTLYVAAGNGAARNHVVLYELNVATGAVIASVDVTPSLVNGEATFGHAGLLLADGLVYVGTGSNCEGSRPINSWLGRVVAVNVATMKIAAKFFSTWNQGGKFGGGGIWSWGGPSADAKGNIYVGTGNGETLNADSKATPPPPVLETTNETTGYADHLVKLSSQRLAVLDSNYPGFNFGIGFADLDYAGTPVLFKPPVGSGCSDLLVATQGKGGTLNINDTLHLNPVLASYALSVPSPDAIYIGNPGYSPNTGYLYAAITSSGNGSSMLPPGLAAIGNCGLSMMWHTSFGADSAAYSYGGESDPRSAPTVTAGGVVFLATPCTISGSGCASPQNQGYANGALWAVDAGSGALLANGSGPGNPVLVTPSAIRMAPSADGSWIWVVDTSGNLYGLTVDPSVPAIQPHWGARFRATYHYRGD